MKNDPNFGKKLFIMIDSHHNAVAGTDIWRFKKPAKGRWKELIAPNECCNTSSTTTTGP